MRASRVLVALSLLAPASTWGCSLVSLDGLAEGTGGGASSTGVGGGASSTADASSSTADAGSAMSASSGGGQTASSSGTGGAGGHGGAGSGGQGGTGTGGAGGGGLGCPDPPVLDDFNRVDGPLGPSWLTPDAFGVRNEVALNSNDGGYDFTHWSTPFGATQVARVTLSQIDPTADEQLLLMKIQGGANMEILYSPSQIALEVWTCDPPCTLRASVPALARNGSVLSARADAAGNVTVCLDGEVKIETEVSDWTPYFANPGRIGIGTYGDTPGMVAAFDDFGGATEP